MTVRMRVDGRRRLVGGEAQIKLSDRIAVRVPSGPCVPKSSRFLDIGKSDGVNEQRNIPHRFCAFVEISLTHRTEVTTKHIGRVADR